MNRAGKLSDIDARAIVTVWSSSGCRITSQHIARKFRQLIQK